VAEEVTRRTVTEKVIGEKPKMPLMLLLKKVKKLPMVKLNQKEENVNQEKNSQNQLWKKRKLVLPLLIMRHKRQPNLKVSLRRLKFVEKTRLMLRTLKSLTLFTPNKQ
jgi:hypothetical protein